jgi:hypothetical protein
MLKGDLFSNKKGKGTVNTLGCNSKRPHSSSANSSVRPEYKCLFMTAPFDKILMLFGSWHQLLWHSHDL